MHYIAYVSLQGLYASEASARLSWPDAKPLVVIRDSTVIDLNRAAIAAGCSLGMGKLEVTAVLADSTCITNFVREEVLQVRDRWLTACTEFSDIIEPEDCHSAFIDLSRHPNALDIARSLKRSIEQATSLEVRLRISSAKWLSKLAPDSLDSFAEAKYWLPRLGIEKLPIDRRDILRLRLLGYRTIGEVASLPKSVVKAQFCERAWLIHELASGSYVDLPRPLFPEAKASSTVEIEGGASEWQIIETAMFKLAAPIAKTMSRLDSMTRTFELEITFDSGKISTFRRSFAKPIHSRTGIVRAIAVMLPKITEPILALKASCPKLERRTRAQITLEESIADTGVSAESALLAIRKTFGESSIRVAGDIEQPRHVEVMRAWKAATGWY